MASSFVAGAVAILWFKYPCTAKEMLLLREGEDTGCDNTLKVWKCTGLHSSGILGTPRSVRRARNCTMWSRVVKLWSANILGAI